MNRELRNVEINKIFVLNPRERNKQIAKEIRQNIEDVGLKRPITISKKAVPQDGYEYDLVCGQGRLEAIWQKIKQLFLLLLLMPMRKILLS